MQNNDKNPWINVLSTLITGIFGLVIAFVGKEALVEVSTKISQSVIANISSVNQNTNQNNLAVNIEGESLFTKVTPTSNPQIQQSSPTNKNCFGSDWINCWQIDDKKQEMTWVGDTSKNADIGLNELPLTKIRNGYTAYVTLDQGMWINICIGAVDGKSVVGECPVIFWLEAGTHVITSPGLSGGFRIYN